MKRLLGIVLVLVGIVVVGVAAAMATVALGIRSRNRRLLRAFTRFQRDVLNPEMLKTAGGAGEQYSVIEHVGRSTGTAYETPVGVRRIDDGWLVSLVYGREASWVQNLLAAGEGVLRTDGERHRIDGFEIVPIAEVPATAAEDKAARFFGTTEALRLHDAGAAEAGDTTDADAAADSVASGEAPADSAPPA